jgi:hypothetical protein
MKISRPLESDKRKKPLTKKSTETPMSDQSNINLDNVPQQSIFKNGGDVHIKNAKDMYIARGYGKLMPHKKKITKVF